MGRASIDWDRLRSSLDARAAEVASVLRSADDDEALALKFNSLLLNP